MCVSVQISQSLLRTFPSLPIHSIYRARLTTSVLVLIPGLKHYAVLSLVWYNIKVPDKKISSHQSDSLELKYVKSLVSKAHMGFPYYSFNCPSKGFSRFNKTRAFILLSPFSTLEPICFAPVTRKTKRENY